MTLSLTPEKLEKIHQLCWEMYNATQVSIRTCEIHRPVIISSTSSPPSQICSNGKYKHCTKLLISTNNRTTLEMQTRASLVDSKQYGVIYDIRLKYSMTGENNTRNVIYGRTKLAYKREVKSIHFQIDTAAALR